MAMVMVMVMVMMMMMTMMLHDDAETGSCPTAIIISTVWAYIVMNRASLIDTLL